MTKTRDSVIPRSNLTAHMPPGAAADDPPAGAAATAKTESLRLADFCEHLGHGTAASDVFMLAARCSKLWPHFSH